MFRTVLAGLVVAAAALAIASTASSGPAKTTTLNGTVGPGFTIKLTKGGAKVKSLKAGTYAFKIADKASSHNFTLEQQKGWKFDKHLTGTGFTGTKTVTSTLLGTLRHDARAGEEFLTRARGEARGARRTALLVSRREAFNAAHRLSDPDLSEEANQRLFGKCVNLHGHNYVLEVAVTGGVDPSTGYVMDLKRLSDLMCREIVQHVDHRNLNVDIPWLAGRIPTAENLAIAFWDRLEPHLPDGALHSVRVWETDKNWAEYRGEG